MYMVKMMKIVVMTQEMVSVEKKRGDLDRVDEESVGADSRDGVKHDEMNGLLS